MPTGSLFGVFRHKKDHRRSTSSPPTDRAINWDDIPAEYRPIGPVGVRTLPIQSQTLTPPQNPQQGPSRPVEKEIAKYNKHSSVLLQLPPPRSMWRRSLGDLSPSKAQTWPDSEDVHGRQMSVQIACAMPPDFFDPPATLGDDGGDDVLEASDGERRRISLPSVEQRTDSKTFRQESARIPTFSRTAETAPARLTKTEGRSENESQFDSPDMTIDTLLTHPMIKTPR